MSFLRDHMILVFTWRRAAFTDALLNFREHMMRAVCESNGKSERVHSLFAHQPKLAISVLARPVNGRTTYVAGREFTGGAPTSIIQQYIEG
ncbi:hypothetical protein BST21_16405 [Mycolicibacterium celeriflavum]|nr:hypothetical protein BST21_16405 [Mycolicibacterium celeriflavum]